MPVEPRRDGVTIKARVEPAMNAYIRVETTSDNPMSLLARIPGHLHGHLQTDERGQISISPIPLGNYELHARTSDGWVGKREVEVSASRSSALVITMEKRAVVSGRVRSAEGRAVAGATVSIGRRIPHELDPHPSMDRLQEFMIETGPEGEFRIPGVEAGTYHLTARRLQGGILPWAGVRGAARWHSKKITITAKSRGPRAGELGDLVVAIPGNTLRGRVLGADGSGRSGVRGGSTACPG